MTKEQNIIVNRIILLIKEGVIPFRGKMKRKTGIQFAAMMLATHLNTEKPPVFSPFNNPDIKEFVLTGKVKRRRKKIEAPRKKENY